MKVTPLWASIALLYLPAVLSQATGTSASPTTTTSPAPSCTASEIANICDYPAPKPGFAIATDSRAFCWDYCNANTPCDFVIYVAGNPFTGSGTCWVYPGETFDASAGSSDCGNPTLFVYSKPTCAGGSSPPTSSGACAATASPSAVASVCGYPTPGDCFEGCTASGGASNCLSQCADADSCSYVVFNPHNPSNSPYGPGSCWIYPNGTYDAGSTTTCSGDPEQYVYNNPCPKPSPSPSTASTLTSSSSPTSHSSTSDYSTLGSPINYSSPPYSSSSSPPSYSTLSSSPSSKSLSPSASAGTSGNKTARPTGGLIASNKNSAGHSLALPSTLLMGMALFLWQGL